MGGLPPTGNEQNIATFFSNALAAVGGTTAGPGVCSSVFTFSDFYNASCGTYSSVRLGNT